MKIVVEYDGEYPVLCFGRLIVTIDGVRWEFPDYCMESGGIVSFDSDWNEYVTSGPWTISKWPDGFPDGLKKETLDAVNEQVPWGCCGGCV